MKVALRAASNSAVVFGSEVMVSMKFCETFPVKEPPRLYVREGSIDTISLSAAVAKPVKAKADRVRDFKLMVTIGDRSEAGTKKPVFS